MRINTNVAALNAQRQLGITNAEVSRSISRLSSGFRINRAADDAAGLGIANKLRSDIRSMGQAARNAEQANTLAQIAEGSVSGIQRMLERMKELATQANSDTVDTAGRERLQEEFTALRAEIQRTVDTTKFGATKLIDGSFGSALDATTSTLDDNASVATGGITVAGVAAGTYTISNGTAGSLVMTGANGVSQTIAVGTAGAQTVSFSEFGIEVELDADYSEIATTTTGTVVVAASGGSFMVGSSGEYTDKDLLSFEALDLDTTSGLAINSLSVTTAALAQSALTGIDTAIDSVNSALGTIGAFQNTVENALANVRTSIENLSASESVIRDLDMAAEMTIFSKNQILAQAGTAMLAQANASSQGILQLLRG